MFPIILREIQENFGDFTINNNDNLRPSIRWQRQRAVFNGLTFFQYHGSGSFERAEQTAARGVAGLGHSVFDVSTGTFQLSLRGGPLVYETLEPIFSRHRYTVAMVNPAHQESVRTLFPTGDALHFFH